MGVSDEGSGARADASERWDSFSERVKGRDRGRQSLLVGAGFTVKSGKGYRIIAGPHEKRLVEPLREERAGAQADDVPLGLIVGTLGRRSSVMAETRCQTASSLVGRV